MTAHALETDRQQALAAGMQDFMAKPVAVDTLQQLVQKWWGHQCC